MGRRREPLSGAGIRAWLKNTQIFCIHRLLVCYLQAPNPRKHNGIASSGPCISQIRSSLIMASWLQNPQSHTNTVIQLWRWSTTSSEWFVFFRAGWWLTLGLVDLPKLGWPIQHKMAATIQAGWLATLVVYSGCRRILRTGSKGCRRVKDNMKRQVLSVTPLSIPLRTPQPDLVQQRSQRKQPTSTASTARTSNETNPNTRKHNEILLWVPNGAFPWYICFYWCRSLFSVPPIDLLMFSCAFRNFYVLAPSLNVPFGRFFALPLDSYRCGQ